jgi:hypothetical protein
MDLRLKYVTFREKTHSIEDSGICHIESISRNTYLYLFKVPEAMHQHFLGYRYQSNGYITLSA